MLLSISAAQGKGPKSFSEIAQPLQHDDDKPWSEPVFIHPNEEAPKQGLPLWNLVEAGLYVTVGTERGFLAASLSPKVTHLLLIDRDVEVVYFNRVNALLLAAAHSRSDYLNLRFKCGPNEWLERIGSLAPQLRKSVDIKAAWKWWKQHVRENEKFENFDKSSGGKGPFGEISYLYSDSMFERLHKMAQEGRIQSTVVQLSDRAAVSRIVRAIKDTGLRVSALDLSNAWDRIYIPRTEFSALLEEFAQVTSRTALLILTKPHFASDGSFGRISSGKKVESMNYFAYTFDQFSQPGEPRTFRSVLEDLEGNRRGEHINRRNIEPGMTLEMFRRPSLKPCPYHLIAN